MSERKGFEHLKEDFPVFIIANKLNVAKTLDLIGDNDVTIPAKAEVPIDSSHLYQLPDASIFKIKSPTISDLVNYGLIKRGGAEQPDPVAPTTPEKPSEDTASTGGSDKKNK